MATLKGKWRFNDTLTTSGWGNSSKATENISFSAKYGSYTKFYRFNNYSNLNGLYYGGNWLVYNFSTHTWNYDDKDIDFGETEQTVSDSFYTWFTTNAISQDTPTDLKPCYLDCNGVRTKVTAYQDIDGVRTKISTAE